MTQMTIDNLKAAFAGESQASVKYQLFAEVAEKAGLANIARLFKATSYAEQVHAKNHLKALKALNTTVENLQTAIDGEDFEVAEMYPAYLAVAELQKFKAAIRSFNYAVEAEKGHSALYNQVKKSADEGKDAPLKNVYVCPVCGYTHEGDEPEDCPVCNVKADKFIKF